MADRIDDKTPLEAAVPTAASSVLAGLNQRHIGEHHVIDAAHPPTWLDLGELWRYRELIWILALRDIKVRYRQAVVGLAWVVLQPVAQTVVFGWLVSALQRRHGDNALVESNLRFEASLFGGLIVWTLFASIVASATNSLVENRHLLTKVYFPRLVLPLAACIRPLLDFSVCLVVLMGMMAWWQIIPGVQVLLFPLVIGLVVLVAFSLGLWLSALNAHYRDFGYIVPFLLQLGMFVSPVVYQTASVVPEEWRAVFGLNPMASLLEAFRWSALGATGPHWGQLAASAIAMLVVLASGAWYFRRVERFLADQI